MNLSALSKLVENLDVETVMLAVDRALSRGVSPMEIVYAVNEGLSKVGKLYEDGKYSIADLMMAGIIFEEVLDLPLMKFLDEADPSLSKEFILVGTILGDIHDIGKTIFSSLASAVGFKVIDLGVDVGSSTFLEAAIKYKPRIIAISTILTTCLPALGDTIELLKSSSDTKDSFILLGGIAVDSEICAKFGADCYARDAKAGIAECIRINKRISKLSWCYWIGIYE